MGFAHALLHLACPRCVAVLQSSATSDGVDVLQWPWANNVDAEAAAAAQQSPQVHAKITLIKNICLFTARLFQRRSALHRRCITAFGSSALRQ